MSRIRSLLRSLGRKAINFAADSGAADRIEQVAFQVAVNKVTDKFGSSFSDRIAEDGKIGPVTMQRVNAIRAHIASARADVMGDSAVVPETQVIDEAIIAEIEAEIPTEALSEEDELDPTQLANVEANG